MIATFRLTCHFRQGIGKHPRYRAETKGLKYISSIVSVSQLWFGCFGRCSGFFVDGNAAVVGAFAEEDDFNGDIVT